MLKDLIMSPTEIDAMAEAGHHGALLRLHLAVHTVYGLYREENTDLFLGATAAMVNVNVSSLVATLEALPEAWPAEHLSDSTIRRLFDLYMDVCTRSTGEEPRAIGLRNLTDLMVDSRSRDVLSPSRGSLEGLWAKLQQGSMSPSLSDEIVRVSGAILGHLLATETGDWDRSAAFGRFGALITESSTDDQVSSPPFPTSLDHRAAANQPSPSTRVTRPPNP